MKLDPPGKSDRRKSRQSFLCAPLRAIAGKRIGLDWRTMMDFLDPVSTSEETVFLAHSIIQALPFDGS